MKKLTPFFFAFFGLVLFSNCGNKSDNKTAEPATPATTATETQEAAKMDSIANELEKTKEDLDNSVRKLEESLKAIEK